MGTAPAAPVLVAVTDAAAARVEGISELLELRVDERRGTLFFGRGDDGLVIVVAAGDRGAIDEVAERFDVRIGVSDPASYDGFAAALDQARVARDRGAGPVTEFSSVARSGVLSALSGEARALAAAELAPLTAHDAEHGTQLVADRARVARQRLLARGDGARARRAPPHRAHPSRARRARARPRPLGVRDPRGAVGGAARGRA